MSKGRYINPFDDGEDFLEPDDFKIIGLLVGLLIAFFGTLILVAWFSNSW